MSNRKNFLRANADYLKKKTKLNLFDFIVFYLILFFQVISIDVGRIQAALPYQKNLGTKTLTEDSKYILGLQLRGALQL